MFFKQAFLVREYDFSFAVITWTYVYTLIGEKIWRVYEKWNTFNFFVFVFVYLKGRRVLQTFISIIKKTIVFFVFTYMHVCKI